MSTKKIQGYAKDSFRQDLNTKRIDEQPINQRVRVIQDNLVFINGLAPSLSSKELLESQLYFGRYGKVTKIIVNPPQPFKKNITYQAYVTYESQIDASVAIVALDGFKLSEKPLKVSYGTTKYCSHFLRGYDCPNNDCYYLHKIYKKRQIINGDSKSVFKQQNNAAIDTVCNNLQQLINRSLNNPNQNIIDGFPTITQMIDFLIQTQILTQSEVELARKKVKGKKITKPQQQISKNNLIDSPKEGKLAKSSSFSTTGSPVKTQKIQVQVKESMIEVVIKQSNNMDVNIDQKIQKQILKQLFKNKKQCKSRFQFVGDKGKCKISQIDKIKDIFQKFLIAQN